MSTLTFKDQLEEDVAVFLNPDEFGEEAVYSRTGETINVLLDKEQEAETGRFIDVLLLKASDVVGLVMGDTFTVGATVYVNASKEPIPMGEKMIAVRVDV